MFAVIAMCAVGRAQNAPAAPPQASAESGTAAATASIAASAGFAQVAGLKAGMSLKEALGILKNLNPAFNVFAFTNGRYEILPNVEMVHMLLARGPRTGLTPLTGMTDNLLLHVATPPSAPVIYQISRRTEWPPNGGPLTTNVLANLRKQYGPETSPAQPLSHKYWWVFDRQGRLVPRERIAKEMPLGPGFETMCEREGGGWSEFLGPPIFGELDHRIASSRGKSGLHTDYSTRLIEKGFDETFNEQLGGVGFAEMKRANAFCRQLVIVAADIVEDRQTGIVIRVDVAMRHFPLMRSAVNATHAMLVQATEEKIKKDREAAAKRR